MNPALPIVLTLSVLGWFGARRARLRELGAAWMLLGLASAGFLAPVLRLPDGVPSPSAVLGRVAPWQEAVGDAHGIGNSNLINVTFQIEPWLLFLRHQLRAGEWPFWNPGQFAGAPFWANDQAAPLFPLHLLFAALPVQLGLVLLPWLRLVAAGLGAYLLARSLGLTHLGGLVAGLIFPLSGMFSSYMLFPMANALCLVPWVLWRCERILQGSHEWMALAVLVGLQWLGGNPETVVHTALLAGVFGLVRYVATRRFAAEGGPLQGAVLRLTLAWCLGTLLAAVHLLPVLYNVTASSRWEAAASPVRAPLGLLLRLPLRVLLPELYGHPAEGTWWGPLSYAGTSVFAGSLGLTLGCLGLIAVLRRRRPALWAVAAVLVFCVALVYQAPGLWDLVTALPGLGKMLHHRLLFGVDLSLGLLAGLGVDRLREGVGRRALALVAAAIAVTLSAAWVLFHAAWREHELFRVQLGWTGWAALAFLLVSVFSRSAAARSRLLALLPVLVFAELFVAHAKTNPPLTERARYPLTESVAFLQDRPDRVAAQDYALRPNAAMVYGLLDIRGDDTLKSRRFFRLEQELNPAASPTSFQPITDWRSPWLDRLDVRWVLVNPGARELAPDWKLVYDGRDARVFQRPTAPGFATWRSGSDEPLSAERTGANSWRLRWRRSESDIIVLAEAWDRGWRVSTPNETGTDTDTELIDDYLIGIPVQAGEGTIELHYRPYGILAGLALSCAAALLVLGTVLSRRVLRRARP